MKKRGKILLVLVVVGLLVGLWLTTPITCFENPGQHYCKD